MKRKKITSEMVANWAVQGYSNQVRDFTKTIENNPEAVIGFCDLAGHWFADYEWFEDTRFKPAADLATESIELLKEFLGSDHPDLVVTIVRSQPHLTVEISWVGGQGTPVLWDRLFVDCEDPVILLTLFSYDGQLLYRLPPPLSRHAPSPMHRYHPERYRASRRVAGKFARIYKDHADFRTGGITQDAFQRAASFVVSEVNERVVTYPRRYRLEEIKTSTVLNIEILLAIAYGRYAQAGRQIMDFPPALCEMLSNTGIDNIPVGEIKLPYACQYLYFGAQKHLEIEPGWLVDGAYIESRGEPGAFKIIMTATPVAEEAYDIWYINPEPSFSLSFNAVHREADLATALDEALTERLNDFFRTEQRSEGGEFQKAKTLLASEGYADLARNVVDVSGNSARAAIDETNRRYPVFLEALKLIINGILYVTAYPEDRQVSYSEKAPFPVRQKALHGNAKEKAKAKSKLEELGYSAVHLCGQSIILHNPNLLPQPTGDGHKSVHWRRGHWRNQRFGEGRTQHRLRWIMPMLVGAKNSPDDDPDLGHVYLVS